MRGTFGGWEPFATATGSIRRVQQTDHARTSAAAAVTVSIFPINPVNRDLLSVRIWSTAISDGRPAQVQATRLGGNCPLIPA